MARLSVNLNKIALLRNSRRTGVPDLLRFARLAINAGSQGITVHPRPDERHIRRADVPAIAGLLAPMRPRIELNIEGYPDDRLLEIARDAKPEQCTLVPDAPDAFTSEKGWELGPTQMQLARPAIVALKALGARVILFIDPDPAVLDRIVEAGAEGVEIYTGSYAAAFRSGNSAALLDACAETARQAQARGLVVNAGHDLNLKNLPPLIGRVPFLAEASIGHELTADALEMGFAAAVRAYAAALAP
jgi:pyridoxine 5-phosphate synthase